MFRDAINHLIKKSDLKNTDYFTYNENRKPTNDKKTTPKYTKIDTPNFSSYVVLDFETTGLSPQNDKIIEVGALKIVDNKVVGNFQTLVDPEITIPPFYRVKNKNN